MAVPSNARHDPNSTPSNDDGLRHYYEWRSEYAELYDGAGLVDLGEAAIFSGGQVEMTGPDAAAFLNRMCTSQVEQLAPGSGTEAFLTDSSGHVVAWVMVFRYPQSLVLHTTGNKAVCVIDHLRDYIIRSKVELHDRSQQWREFLLAGQRAGDVLEKAICETSPLPRAGEGQGVRAPSIPPSHLAHIESEVAGISLSIRRVNLASVPVFLLSTNAETATALSQALQEAGARACGWMAAEAFRIEAGWPVNGLDITRGNLPQEVARDDRCISFSKGCYLGQETVARIQSRGHVNRFLVGLKFSTRTVPPHDTQLTADGKPAGWVTSSAFSPHLDAALALGYVGRAHRALGTRLDSPLGPVEVVALPLQPARRGISAAPPV